MRYVGVVGDQQMPLTEAAVRNAKPGPKDFKLSDGGGLQLHVKTTGSKLWRLAYRHDGKQKTLAIGVYPSVGLGDARDARHEAKRKLRDGTDPSALKRLEKAAAEISAANTFSVVADEWLERIKQDGAKPGTLNKLSWLVELARPRLGVLPIADIT